MICPHCRTIIDNGLEVCSYCNRPLKTTRFQKFTVVCIILVILGGLGWLIFEAFQRAEAGVISAETITYLNRLLFH